MKGKLLVVVTVLLGALAWLAFRLRWLLLRPSEYRSITLPRRYQAG